MNQNTEERLARLKGFKNRVKNLAIYLLAAIIIIVALVWYTWGYWAVKEAILIPATNWIPEWVKDLFWWWSGSSRY